MFRKKKGSFLVLSCQINLLILSYLLLSTQECGCYQKEAILLTPASVDYLRIPYRSLYDSIPLNYKYRVKPPYNQKPTRRLRGPVIDQYLRIEPSDAISDLKYSRPAVNYHAENSYPDRVPLKTSFGNEQIASSQHNSSHSLHKKHVLSSNVQQNSSSLSKNVRFLENENIPGNISERNHSVELNDSHAAEYPSDTITLNSNETESENHLISSASDKVLNYEIPSSSFDDDGYKYKVPSKKSSERAIEDAPSHFSDISKFIYSDANASTPVVPDHVTPPFVLHSHIFDEILNRTDSLDSSDVTLVPSMYDVENISSSSISFPSENRKLSTATVAGIVIGVLVCTTILSSAVIYLLYQKYNGKCTGVVEGKFNSDNCGYLDDSLRSSIYLNNHIELPKESSEEMSSLDNDSFLNSLETMTIQNYWTDSSKNTKV